MKVDYMNPDEYILHCCNMVRCLFIDKYLYSVEHDKMRTQARINYLVYRRYGRYWVK